MCAEMPGPGEKVARDELKNVNTERKRERAAPLSEGAA